MSPKKIARRSKPDGRKRRSQITESDRARASSISTALERYFLDYGRAFPWRSATDPYAIAVSEVLLTKTRAESAVATWREIVRQYPNPRALATAVVEDLEILIKPLGLSNKRALHLRDLGEFLDRNGVEVLRRRETAIEVPGLGRYAAAALSCFVFGEAIGIVDANVRRVLTRVFNIRHPKTQRGNDRRLAALADLVAASAADPRAANYGVLDLGAAVCVRKPICGACPLRASCRFAIRRMRRTGI